jgi:hypothetical protein
MPDRRAQTAKAVAPFLLFAALFAAVRLIGVPEIDPPDVPDVPGWIDDVPGWVKLVVVKGKFVLLALIIGCAVLGDVWRRRRERRR